MPVGKAQLRKAFGVVAEASVRSGRQSSGKDVTTPSRSPVSPIPHLRRTLRKHSSNLPRFGSSVLPCERPKGATRRSGAPFRNSAKCWLVPRPPPVSNLRTDTPVPLRPDRRREHPTAGFGAFGRPSATRQCGRRPNQRPEIPVEKSSRYPPATIEIGTASGRPSLLLPRPPQRSAFPVGQ